MKTRKTKQIVMAVVALMTLLPMRSMAASATLSIEDFTIKGGETKTMLIDVHNTDMQVTLVQFDMRLPKGLSVDKEENDYAIGIAGRTTYKKHSVSVNLIDSLFRVMLHSSNREVLSGTSGAVLSIKLTATSSFNGGNILLENIKIVAPDTSATTSKPGTYIYEVATGVSDSVTLAANSYTRQYGEENPAFGYEVTNGTISSGKPTLTCSASKTTPVGTYDIVIQKGTVTNGVVSLVNGTLTITKAPLTIAAGDYTRVEGEQNPAFTPTFSGFKNGETSSVLTTQPTLTTTATASSPAGTYPVTVSGAEAQNYSMSYQNGTLTVTAKPVPTLTLSTLEINDVPAEEGVKTITVTANTAWNATSSQEWIIVTPTSGSGDVITVQINIQKNESAVERTGYVTFTAEGMEPHTLTITQKGQVVIDSDIITFADPNVKAICIANWDTNGDGELSKQEAAAVTSLGQLFRDNKTITSFNELQFFTGLTSIGDYAFEGCSGLTSITIPNSVTSIGYQAFYGCSGLTSVTIGNSVTSIGWCAFSGCSGLTSVTIPNSVTSIGNYAFDGCSGLTSVTIGNSVTSIGYQAFCGCSGLTSVTIPNSVTSIENGAFESCSGLTSITIPNSVTSIENYAFRNCSGLTSITIPNSVTSIGWCAFSGCSGLTSVTIPNSVTSIGERAFDGCSGLTSVIIPNSVTTIGRYAFYGCI